MALVSRAERFSSWKEPTLQCSGTWQEPELPVHFPGKFLTVKSLTFVRTGVSLECHWSARCCSSRHLLCSCCFWDNILSAMDNICDFSTCDLSWERGVSGGVQLCFTHMLPHEGDWIGSLVLRCSSWDSAVAPGGALGSVSAARISARMEVNIHDTLVNCSKNLVGGRGKKRGWWGCLFLLCSHTVGSWWLGAIEMLIIVSLETENVIKRDSNLSPNSKHSVYLWKQFWLLTQVEKSQQLNPI